MLSLVLDDVAAELFKFVIEPTLLEEKLCPSHYSVSCTREELVLT